MTIPNNPSWSRSMCNYINPRNWKSSSQTEDISKQYIKLEDDVPDDVLLQGAFMNPIVSKNKSGLMTCENGMSYRGETKEISVLAMVDGVEKEVKYRVPHGWGQSDYVNVSIADIGPDRGVIFSERQWVHGDPEGPGKVYMKDGTIISCQFKAGYRHGLATVKDSLTNKTWECYYSMNKLVDKFEEWPDLGQKSFETTHSHIKDFMDGERASIASSFEEFKSAA